MKFPKLKAVGRALVELFDQSGPSAPPEIGARAFGVGGHNVPFGIETIGPGDPRYADMMRMLGMMPPQDPPTAADLAVAAARPSLPHGISEYPDDLSWGTWKSMSNELRTPGWSFCRFANRTEDNEAGQVFGIVRGPFGIFLRPWPVCNEADESHDVMKLAGVTHLPSGGGFGLFMTVAHAVVACEIAMSMPGMDYENHIDPTDPATWDDTQTRLNAAWTAAGIVVAPVHAHHDSGGILKVRMMTHASTTEGKPERLS